MTDKKETNHAEQIITDSVVRQKNLETRVKCHKIMIAAVMANAKDLETGELLITEEAVKYFIGLVAFQKVPFMYIAYQVPQETKTPIK